MRTPLKTSVLRKALELFSVVLPSVFWCLVIFGFEDVLAATATILSAVIHECGHIFYIVFRHLPSHGVRGVLSGLRIRTASVTSYDDKILTYLAGPAANILAFFVVTFLIGPFGNFFLLLGTMNLATAVSNLLPIEGYDGYGVLSSMIEKYEVGGWALRLLSGISASLIFLLCLFSLYLIDRQGGGYWIFAVFFVMMIKQIGRGLSE